MPLPLNDCNILLVSTSTVLLCWQRDTDSDVSGNGQDPGESGAGERITHAQRTGKRNAHLKTGEARKDVHSTSNTS